MERESFWSRGLKFMIKHLRGRSHYVNTLWMYRVRMKNEAASFLLPSHTVLGVVMSPIPKHRNGCIVHPVRRGFEHMILLNSTTGNGGNCRANAWADTARKLHSSRMSWMRTKGCDHAPGLLLRDPLAFCRRHNPAKRLYVEERYTAANV